MTHVVVLIGWLMKTVGTVDFFYEDGRDRRFFCEDGRDR
jgi:hypothetical protein